ncbi:hypothetical protein D6C78_10297 [Aureobasidium pullulans]|uniref:Uncharacterized protein n=1 Tax=Aureobasidium pullulans TaxID=5580 RepID=A0A4T0B5M8_AURPU|nr:hypothetical protein D6C78_10297 [Aureobasidium pullulans]
MPNKEDLVPGGSWVSVPGTDARSGLCALSLAMATNSSVSRTPIWDPRPDPRSGTRAIEVLNCTLLKAVWEGDVILRSPEFLASQPSELLSIFAVMTHKNALIRYANGRWEAFTYFKQDVSEISVDKLKLTSAPSLTSITRDPFATYQDNDPSDTN